MGAVSSHSEVSSGEGGVRGLIGPDQAFSGGGKMSKLARTPQFFAAQDKNDDARGHNLESVMDVEIPLTISKKERKSHMKKVKYDILEQQCKEKMKL
jgi:hypothetical protein